MAKADRLKIIGQIENSLNTKLICYVTGDRQNLATAIAEDVVRLIYSHQEGIGTQDRIVLFLYTRGGHPMPAYRIVNLAR